MAPALEPLQRTITEHAQGLRDKSAASFKESSLGRYVSERAELSAKNRKPLEPWEKDLLQKLDGDPKSKGK
jgi:putative lipoic acid-binding regulatory protein